VTQLGHVKDLATAFVKALGNPKAFNQIYNLAGEEQPDVRVKSICLFLICSGLGTKPGRKKRHLKEGPGLCVSRHKYSSIQTISRWLGWNHIRSDRPEGSPITHAVVYGSAFPSPSLFLSTGQL